MSTDSKRQDQEAKDVADKASRDAAARTSANAAATDNATRADAARAAAALQPTEAAGTEAARSVAAPVNPLPTVSTPDSDLRTMLVQARGAINTSMTQKAVDEINAKIGNYIAKLDAKNPSKPVNG